MLGHHRPASETPFKWYLDPLSPYQLKKKRNVIDFGPPLTKFSESVHGENIALSHVTTPRMSRFSFIHSMSYFITIYILKYAPVVFWDNLYWL